MWQTMHRRGVPFFTSSQRMDGAKTTSMKCFSRTAYELRFMNWKVQKSSAQLSKTTSLYVSYTWWYRLLYWITKTISLYNLHRLLFVQINRIKTRAQKHVCHDTFRFYKITWFTSKHIWEALKIRYFVRSSNIGTNLCQLT